MSDPISGPSESSNEAARPLTGEAARPFGGEAPGPFGGEAPGPFGEQRPFGSEAARPFSWNTGASGGGPSISAPQPADDPFLRAPFPAPKRGNTWLAIVAGVSTTLFLASSALALWLWQSGGSPDAPSEPTPFEPVTTPSAPSPHAAEPAPSSSAAPQPTQSASEAAPRRTKVAKVGKITIADIGVDSPKTLAEELSEQRALAQTARQTLVLMTTQFGKREFRDVDAAFSDPLLQSALANVRVVRVDCAFFENELRELGVPTDGVPWFLLLGADLVPRDGIDGGEWDDDIPRNIAPVLDAFVHGSYKTRRQSWKPPPGKGVQL